MEERKVPFPARYQTHTQSFLTDVFGVLVSERLIHTFQLGLNKALYYVEKCSYIERETLHFYLSISTSDTF
jgi:hypothetical protein